MGLLVTGQVQKLVLNDLDPAIFAFWRTLKNEPDYLVRQIGRARLDVEEWRKQKKIYAAADERDERKLGFATFYLNRTNRSGVLNGGPIGGLDQTGHYKIDARFNREALVERVRIISLYADQIEVLSEDGASVIRRYAPKAKTFIYADPPYFEKAGSLYLNHFAAADHEVLARVLNAQSARNWVLTYDNVSQVEELYSERRRRIFGLNYSAHRVVKAKEVMVLSDTIREPDNLWTL